MEVDMRTEDSKGPAENGEHQANRPVRQRTSQRDLPKNSLDECLKIPRAIIDNYAGHPTAPHDVAIALTISPTSSAWRSLTGAAVGYGLTEGAYNSPAITPTALSKRILEPTEEGDDVLARHSAVIGPTIPGKFFKKYAGAKFPRDDIAKNVLKELGVPKDDCDRALEILKQNGASAEIIRETKTGPFVALNPLPRPQVFDGTPGAAEAVSEEERLGREPPRATEPTQAPLVRQRESAQAPSQKHNNRVFISHGKNKKIMNQIKDMLRFGKFEPVVAIEHETPSKPVPEKVLDDMRSCFAGVIHVEAEEVLLDQQGEPHHKLNDNVLIEIGAAMALYKGRFILLVQKGLQLPSNLQGLYLCEYEGNSLDFNAAMKLLKTFNEFQ